jgi:autotransporter-associated beta strand protein
MPGMSRASRPVIRAWNAARLLRAACLVMMGLTAPAPAAATTYFWIGSSGGDWADKANWNPSTGFPNGAADIAIVNGGASALVIGIPPTVQPSLQKLTVIGGSGLIVFLGVNSSISLSPVDDQPAIEYTGTGGLEFQTRIFFSSRPLNIVRAGTSSSTITFRHSISQTEGPKGLRKQGPGVVRFDAENSYTGTTIVEQGHLVLMKSKTIADTANVEVRKDAFLLTLTAEVIGDLIISEGVVDISPDKSGLVVSSLHMTGGNIHSSAGGKSLHLRGNVTATSSPSQQPAIIEPSVNIVLVDVTRTFTVLDGPGSTDLEIRASIFPSQAVAQITAAPADESIGLIKDGPGTLVFTNSAPANQYQGLTWVKEGRLTSDRTVGKGDLRIGDGVGPAGQAEFLPLVTNMIPAARSVTVEADGFVQISSLEETFDRLTVNGGRVDLAGGTGASIRMQALVMNGGLIQTGKALAPSSVVLLGTSFEATSTATQTATIRGGDLTLVLAVRPALIVNNGPQPIDLSIESVIGTLDNFGLRKSGPGVARFTKNNTYTGETTVAAGTLLIDGNQLSTQVTVLAAATLGGTGTVAGIFTLPGATVAPGASAGVLRGANGNSLAASLAEGSTLAAEILSATSFDQLGVTGTVTLSNPTLGLTLANGITLPVNTNFKIIDNDLADAVNGTFANLPEGATLIVDRYTFTLSYRGGDGNDVVLTVTDVGPDVLTYYLAEGATGAFFDEDVLIANPNDSDAPVTLTFLQEGGGTIIERRTVPKQGRLTVHVDQINELENASPSVQVDSDNKLPLIVERSMFWDASYYGGHTANAVAKPERKWIFAEGFQGFFDTYLLIANANAVATTATVTFLRENDTPVVKTIPIAAFARKTIYAGEFTELIGRAFGMVVDATQPVIAERSMYFASLPSRLWTGGHVNTGVTAPSTSWFHAEGATGGFFSTFILLSNPQLEDAHIELRFLLEDGTTIVKTKTLLAGQRLTVNPASEGEPRLANAAMSTIVESDVPIVSERSMYWPEGATPFGEGHNSSGVVSTATRWGLAEGRIGAPRNFTTYILLANPSATAANVTVTYLREAGAPVTKTYTVPPTSRFNIDVAGAVPELHDESFGARIEVTNGVPIAVERSLYWDANGIFWAGGTNALATPLP